MKTINKAIEILEVRKDRSAWDKAITIDAITLIEHIETCVSDGWNLNELTTDIKAFTKATLNGARTWSNWSYGGCGLIYDGDIARHYCTPSELRKNNNGSRNPSKSETWLDLQARAMGQANVRAYRAIKEAMEV